MRILDATELSEFNRVLAAVRELSGGHSRCSRRAMLTLCASVTFGGRPVDHARTLRSCEYAELVTLSKGLVALTEKGRRFLSLNPSRSYELTDAQKRFVAEHVILSGPWQARARDLFLSFSPNHSEVTYELCVAENPLPLRYSSAVYLLRHLGVLAEADGILRVAPEYVASVVQLLADRGGSREEDLTKALDARRKLGVQAEEAVLEFEHNRLGGLGRNAEASLVRRISQLDVGAGYDIESFDGDRPLFDYDRFIEVKASQGAGLRFYWTANERQAAERLGDRYWIYFVGGFRSAQRGEIEPIMIRDPAGRLHRMSGLRVEIAVSLVTQKTPLDLEPIAGEQVKGFAL